MTTNAEAMTTEECQFEITKRMGYAATPFHATGSEEEKGDTITKFFQALYEAFTNFVRDYVQLPPRQVMLDSFGVVIDAALLPSQFPGLVKMFLRGSLMSAAASLYDITETYREQHSKA